MTTDGERISDLEGSLHYAAGLLGGKYPFLNYDTTEIYDLLLSGEKFEDRTQSFHDDAKRMWNEYRLKRDRSVLGKLFGWLIPGGKAP